MTNRVKQELERYLSHAYRADRTDTVTVDDGGVAEVPRLMHEADVLRAVLAAETPLIRENDVFGFNRTTKGVVLPNGKTKVKTSNITVDYGAFLGKGTRGLRAEVKEAAAHHTTALHCAILKVLDAIEEFCERYRVEAERIGNPRLAEALSRLPEEPAETFYDALVMQKILTFAMRAAGYVHCTLGRFDRYMFPYYEHDRQQGVTQEELLELLELYFISLNLDTDLYFGMQQGDNGQSIVLFGVDERGKPVENELSYLCLDASEELSLIDPKINVRVNKNTSLDFYERCTRITAKGLGFPQYSNDDIVIPGLVKVGYALEDARDYAVAACWEFTVPGKGADVPNWNYISFPTLVNRAIVTVLGNDGSFEDLLAEAEKNIREYCEEVVTRPHYLGPAPLLSMLMQGCIESGVDISEFGAKYTNLGCHGIGLSSAADALAAVKKTVFDEKSIQKADLLAALAADFCGYAALRNRLLDCPKMGNNDDFADTFGVLLMTWFSKYLNGRKNAFGGIWRAGTGSANLYTAIGKECPATADGRHAGEPFASSYSPSITAKVNGPLSVVQSFSKFDLTGAMNGGPLTIEIHDTVFRNEEGYRKVAALVKAYIDRGGHQMQINAVNRDRLLKAQAHPEEDPNLIVRVWGWSGYFCELDKEYQDHIIRRTEFQC